MSDWQTILAIDFDRDACERRDHEMNEPAPTVMAPTGGKSGLGAVSLKLPNGGQVLEIFARKIKQ